jgi:hypothetical protein
MTSIKLVDAVGYIYSDRYGVVSSTLGVSIRKSNNNTTMFTKLYRKDGEDYILLTAKDIINVFDMQLFEKPQNVYGGYSANTTPKEIEFASAIITFANQTFEFKVGEKESFDEFLFQEVWQISNTNLEALMDFEIKQDMLVACKNEGGRIKTWKVAELYHQPNYQNMLCKLQSITDAAVMEIPCYPLDSNGKRITNNDAYTKKTLYKVPYVEYPQRKNELEIFDVEIRESELNPFWVTSAAGSGKGNLYWQPIEEASQYTVALYKYRTMDSLEKKLYLLEKFVVDRNKCWVTLDNLFGNNYIVRIEAENRSGLPVALSRGIPIQMPSKTNQIQWQGVKL